MNVPACIIMGGKVAVSRIQLFSVWIPMRFKVSGGRFSLQLLLPPQLKSIRSHWSYNWQLVDQLPKFAPQRA